MKILNQDLLPDFFEWLEHHNELAKDKEVKIIKEWGISNSTLEDVFMRLIFLCCLLCFASFALMLRFSFGHF